MAQQFRTFEDFNGYIRSKSVEDEDFRARLLADPRTVLAEELDLNIPDGFEVHVHEDSSAAAHFVIPPSAKLSDEEMHAVSGGQSQWCVQRL